MDPLLIAAMAKVATRAYLLPPRARRVATMKTTDEEAKTRAFDSRPPMNRQLPGEYGVKLRKPPTVPPIPPKKKP